jgi:phage baseplate assembly protein W
VAAATLASAADLAGADLGGGTVSLSWVHPDDPAQGTRFDVYSSDDPLDAFRTRRLAGFPGTATTLSGFDRGGDVYLTVVAVRDGTTALPSRVLHLRVQPVGTPVDLVRAEPSGVPSGLAFPFGISAAGAVLAQQGNPLLRGKVLQLLLTSPGERVNQPDYGTGLRDLVFDPDNEILAATTEFTVARALRRFLGDQLEVESVQVTADDTELTIEVVYLSTADLQAERLRVGIPVSG